jgi:hypothetical protein
MRQSLFTLAFCALLAGAGHVHADHLKKYFPLAVGNKWACVTYKGKDVLSTSIASQSGSSYLLMGFPLNPNGLWVSFVGETLFVWSNGPKKWNPLFPFGGAVGTELKFSPGLFSGGTVHVKLKAKSVTVSNPLLGEVRSQGVHFRISQVPWIGKSTEYDFYFVPGVGIFTWSVTVTFALG